MIITSKEELHLAVCQMKTKEKRTEKKDVSLSELTTLILQALHSYDEVDDQSFREIIADIINQSQLCSHLSLEDKRHIATTLFNRMRRKLLRK